MYRRLNLDLPRLAQMSARGLSDPAIGRVLKVSRQTVFNYRHRLGLPPRQTATGRMRQFRARHLELDRLWARLSLPEKTAALLREV
jgi:hypothetical protein